MTDPEPAPRIRPVVGGRSPARERALHLLYEGEVSSIEGPEVLAAQIVAPDRYAEQLVEGTHRHAERIDGIISELLPDAWSLARLAMIDRTIMRIAVYELAYSDDVPTGVVLSEAVALAETYGTDESPRFVNGLLAAAARQLRE